MYPPEDKDQFFVIVTHNSHYVHRLFLHMTTALSLFVYFAVAARCGYGTGAGTGAGEPLSYEGPRTAEIGEHNALSSSGLVPGPIETLGRLESKDYRKIVVIPDVHGDMNAFIEALFVGLKKVEQERSAITLEEFSARITSAMKALWFDDKTAKLGQMITNDPGVALVLLGDLMDRGPQSTECIMIMKCVGKLMGWTVRTLYGNHELFNMAGQAGDQMLPGGFIPGYVHPDDSNGFGCMGRRLESMLPAGAEGFTDDGLARTNSSLMTHPGHCNRIVTDSFLAMIRV